MDSPAAAPTEPETYPFSEIRPGDSFRTLDGEKYKCLRQDQYRCPETESGLLASINKKTGEVEFFDDDTRVTCVFFVRIERDPETGKLIRKAYLSF